MDCCAKIVRSAIIFNGYHAIRFAFGSFVIDFHAHGYDFTAQRRQQIEQLANQFTSKTT